MKTRLIALIVLLSSSPAFAQSITLTSLDRSTIASFGVLTVSGSGFDAANGAISVIVSPRGGVATTIPVYSATATAVKAIVPPLINSANGELFDAPVAADAQVVQVTRSSVTTSNVLGGLTVQPAPQAPGAIGAATTAFLKTMLDVNTDLRAGLRSSPAMAGVSAATNQMTAPTNQLIEAAKVVAADRERTASLTTTDDQPLGMNQKTLRISDRVALAYVQQTLDRASGGNAIAGPLDEVPGGCQCAAYTGDPRTDEQFCQFRKNPCNAYAVATKVVPAAATGVYGAELGFIAGWAAGGLASAGLVAEEAATAIGYLAGQAINYTAATFAGTDPPSIMSAIKDAGATVLDTVAARGLPVFSGTLSGFGIGQVLEPAIAAAKGVITDAPQAGVVLPAPPGGGLPSGSRSVIGYLAQPAAPATATTLAASQSPNTITFTAATLSAPTVARFNGAYSGTTSGSCTVTFPDGSETIPFAGPVTMSVSGGGISVGGSGSGAGSVSANGVITSGAAAAAGATCRWGGRFWEDGTNAGATGYVGCTAPLTVCTGGWSVGRGR